MLQASFGSTSPDNDLHAVTSSDAKLSRLWWRLVPSLLRWIGPGVVFVHRHAWLLLTALMAIVILFGAWGFWGHLASRDPRPTISEVLYLSLQLFSLESGANVPGAVEWRLEVARFLGAFVMVGAAARALAMFFYNRFLLFMLSLFGQEHVIVCGLGSLGTRLVDELRKRGEWVVVVESDSANEALKRCLEMGITVVMGDSTDEYTLRKVRLHRARALISVVGKDGTNVETAVLARRLNAVRRDGLLRCIIHVADRELRIMLAKTRLTADPHDAFDLRYFDVFESCARVMLRESQFLPAVRPAVEANRHLLVIGFGRLGETLVLRAARDAGIEGEGAIRDLRVTVIDQHAREKEERFRSLHPRISAACTVRFIALELHQPDFRAGAFLRDDDGAVDVSTVYVCLGDDSLGMLAALTMHERLRETTVPVIVRLSEEAGFAAALVTDAHAYERAGRIRAVGLLELSCNVDLVLDGTCEILARTIHQGYVRQHLLLGETVAENRSLVMWEDLPAELRESNRDRARHLEEHLARVNCRMTPVRSDHPEILRFTEREIDVLARLEHERWCREKRRPSLVTQEHGFDTLAATRWEDCPAKVREFNRQMVAAMPLVLAKADFEVRRNA